MIRKFGATEWAAHFSHLLDLLCDAMMRLHLANDRAQRASEVLIAPLSHVEN